MEQGTYDPTRNAPEQDAECEQSKKRQELFTAICHQLHLTLTAFIDNSETLRKGEANPKKIRLLNEMLHSGHGQLYLLDLVQELSAIESGNLKIVEESYNLSTLVKEVTEETIPRLNRAELDFKIEQLIPQECWLRGDRKRITGILRNLLRNSIRLTRKGGISIAVAQQGERFSIRIEDTAIGIAQESIEQLLHPLQWMDQVLFGSEAIGTGLGLYLSSQLAQLMGGEITISSRGGEGMCYELTLPYRVDREPASALAENRENRLPDSDHKDHSDRRLSPRKQPRFQGNVLIVEDIPMIQQLEQSILEPLGVEVTIANNGQEAVEQVQLERFDMILMDMLMPVMGGVEATRKIREDEIRKGDGKTPIVALSANINKKQLAEFKAAGGSGVINKPLVRGQLLKVLEKFLVAVAPDEESLPSEYAESVVISAELEQEFQQRLLELTAALEQGRQQEDWGEVHQAAHVIKGSAASFGFAELSDLSGAVCRAYDKSALVRLPQLTVDLIRHSRRVLQSMGRSESGSVTES